MKGKILTAAFAVVALLTAVIVWQFAYDLGRRDQQAVSRIELHSKQRDWQEQRERIEAKWTELAIDHNMRIQAECIHCDAVFTFKDYTANASRCPQCDAHGVALESWGVPTELEVE